MISPRLRTTTSLSFSHSPNHPLPRSSHQSDHLSTLNNNLHVLIRPHLPSSKVNQLSSHLTLTSPDRLRYLLLSRHQPWSRFSLPLLASHSFVHRHHFIHLQYMRLRPDTLRSLWLALGCSHEPGIHRVLLVHDTEQARLVVRFTLLTSLFTSPYTLSNTLRLSW